MRARFRLYVATGCGLAAASVTLLAGSTWAAPVGLTGLMFVVYGASALIEYRRAAR